MLKKIKKAADFIKSKFPDFHSETGIILGSGLGRLSEEVEIIDKIPYGKIPGFKTSTVKGHNGILIYGKLAGVKVLVMDGRIHYYEGYSMKNVTFPERVMNSLGIKYLLLSNASGGMNQDFKVGDLMIINDHINMFPEHPLRGKNEDTLGPRFPAMKDVYDKELIQMAKDIAVENNIEIEEGVYVGVQGPAYETPSEYRLYHGWKGDAVGMSTVPEAIVAHHMNMKVFGISVITDMWRPDDPQDVSHEEVQKMAKMAEPRMALIFRELVKKIKEQK